MKKLRRYKAKGWRNGKSWRTTIWAEDWQQAMLSAASDLRVMGMGIHFRLSRKDGIAIDCRSFSDLDKMPEIIRFRVRGRETDKVFYDVSPNSPYQSNESNDEQNQ